MFSPAHVNTRVLPQTYNMLISQLIQQSQVIWNNWSCATKAYATSYKYDGGAAQSCEKYTSLYSSGCVKNLINFMYIAWGSITAEIKYQPTRTIEPTHFCIYDVYKDLIWIKRVRLKSSHIIFKVWRRRPIILLAYLKWIIFCLYGGRFMIYIYL